MVGGATGGRRKLLSRYGTLLRQRSFPAFLTAGALQFAAPATVLVVLLYSIAVAYPGLSASSRTAYAALDLTFLGLSSTLPTLASAFFSGALADRHERGQLMRVVNLAAIVATVGVALDLGYAPATPLSAPGPAGYYIPLWMLLLYPSYTLLTVTSALFRPAFNTSVPKIVAPNELGRANGLIYAVAATVSLVGTALVGVLLALAGPVYALGVPFALYVVTQVALVRVDADLSVSRRTPPRSVLAEAREGFVYLGRRRDLLEITIAALVVNFLQAVALVEVALYLRDWLGLLNGFWYGALVAVLTAGVAVGFLVVAQMRFEARAGRVIILATLAMGVALFAFGIVRSIWLALPIAFVYGLMPGMISNVALSFVQSTVPDDTMGRVFSADEVGSYALVPVGQVAGGILLLTLGVQGLYLVSGAALAFFAVIMVVTFGSLRRLRYSPHVRSAEARSSS